ncbi:MAG TPA: cation diffusion facilitator family transporter [Burkholderiales bacterium]|nr:cation diffusion facilitator family transporter [Burkholderiales bacterium]
MHGRSAFAAALVITLVYAFIELGGGLWSGSLALVSDAGHMFSDVFALGLAAGAAWLAQRPVGHRHSYGWARAEVVGAFINGLLMLGIVVWLVVEAVQRLLHQQPVQGAGVIVIASIGLVLNGVVAYILGHSEETLNRRAALVHVLGDLLSSLAAVIAGAVIYFTGWVLIDPILSLVIGMLILGTTVQLLREALHVLMEGVPHAVDFAQIGTALASVAGVSEVHDLHIWSIASHRTALSAHVEISRLDEWPGILDACRHLLRHDFGIEHVTLQPEERGTARIPHHATVTLHPREAKKR